MKRLLLAGAAAALLCGCQATIPSWQADQSGFLGDYSMLEKGKFEEQALYVYRNKKIDFKKYTKVIFEPITVWKSVDKDLDAQEKKELQAQIDYLDSVFRKALSDHYTIVTKPGKDVMVLRLAVTEATKSAPVRDLMSNIVPISMAVTAVKRVSTGSYTAVGHAQLEGEIADSLTNTRIMAAVDARGGNKRLKGKFDEWEDVREAYKFWAERFSKNLTELKQQ